MIAFKALAQRFTLDELHRRIRLTLVLTDQINLHDVRVIELRHAARFPEKRSTTLASSAKDSASILIATWRCKDASYPL